MPAKNSKKEEELAEKTKKLSIKEGVAYSVMDGAGIRYLTPYALAIGASNAQIGFLTSIPSLLGNFSQLVSSKFMEKFSRKKIIVISVLFQALMWLPIIALGYWFFYKNVNNGLSANLLILFYSALIIFGAFASPAWHSLMRDNVGKGRGHYFSKRNRIIGASSLVIMLASGLILNYFEKSNLVFIGFAIIFGMAFASRLISTYFLSKHYDPEFRLNPKLYFNLWEFIKGIPRSNFGKFSLFISLVMLATYIVSPFFAVYILRDLGYSYAVWAIIIISSSLSSFLFLPLWGKFSDRFGNLKVLRITGAITPLVPLAWFVTFFLAKINPSVVLPYLLCTEFISGFVWAGFNLSAVNFIYDAVTRPKIGLCVAYYSILNGTGIFIGATLGGILASLNISFLGLTPILFVMLVSGIARLLVYFFMIPRIKEVREVEPYHDGELRKEIIQQVLHASGKITNPRNTLY